MVKSVVSPKDPAPLKKWKCSRCKNMFERAYTYGPKPSLCTTCKSSIKEHNVPVAKVDHTEEVIGLLKNALFNSKMVSEEIYEAQNTIKFLIFILWLMQILHLSIFLYSLRS